MLQAKIARALIVVFTALLVWFSLSLLANAVHAAAPPPVAKAWMEDAGGRLTLAQAQQGSFAPFDGILTQGYRANSVVWIRLRVAAGQAPGTLDVLRVRPTWHDRVELFDPAHPSEQPRLNGDRTAWSQTEHPSLTLDFLVPRTATPRDLYLRVQSVHTYMVDVELMSMVDAARESVITQLIQLAYVSLLMVVLVWSMATALRQPEPVLAAFVLVQWLALLHALLLVGTGRPLLEPWLPANWIDQITSLSVLLYSAGGIFFHMLLLSEYPLHRRSVWLMRGYLLVSLSALLVFLAGRETEALQLNAWVILLFSVHLLAVVWSARLPAPAKPHLLLPFGFLRWFYLVFSVATVMGAIALIGLLDARGFQMYAFFPHGFISAVVMALLLQHRVKLRERHQQEALQSQTRQAQEERRLREEQSSFMAMLNHEIKTPLSVVRLSLSGSPGKAAGQKAVDEIVRLLDRCLLLEDMDSRVEFLRRETFSFDQLVRSMVEQQGRPSRFDLTHMPPMLLNADRLLCETMVGNLLENALKYAPEDTPIRVQLDTVYEPGCRVRLRVSNAVGRMGAPDVARAFDKYYRAPGARAVSGSGLGLYIVRRLARMHDGDVRVDPSPDTVHFELLLPC